MRKRRSKSGSAIAEFAPALLLLLIVTLLPLIDVVSLFVGVGVLLYTVNVSARQAATKPSPQDARQAVALVGKTFISGPFGSFVKIQPANNDGLRLLIEQAPVDAPTRFSPLAQGPTDEERFVYQYRVTARYSILPLFNFAAVPLLQSVPGLGAPFVLTTSSSSHIEHPSGLSVTDPQIPNL